VLGWEFFVSRQSDPDEMRALATWRAGLSGTDWLDDLVAKGMAMDLGGNGYPDRYALSVAALCAALEFGAPKHIDPPVIGDDYITPSGWSSPVTIDRVRLRTLDPNEILVVEAWDQS